MAFKLTIKVVGHPPQEETFAQRSAAEGRVNAVVSAGGYYRIAQASPLREVFVLLSSIQHLAIHEE